MSESELSARQLASLPEILIPKIQQLGEALGSIDMVASEALINGACLRIRQLEAAVAALIESHPGGSEHANGIAQEAMQNE